MGLSAVAEKGQGSSTSARTGKGSKRCGQDKLGKLPLGKLHIWEVAYWEVAAWEKAFGKEPNI